MVATMATTSTSSKVLKAIRAAAGEVVVEATAAADTTTTTWVEVEGLPHLGRACTTMCHSPTPTRDHLDEVEASAREEPLMLSTHRQPTPRQGQRMLGSPVQTTVVVDEVETEASTLTLDERTARELSRPITDGSQF